MVVGKRSLLVATAAIFLVGAVSTPEVDALFLRSFVRRATNAVKSAGRKVVSTAKSVGSKVAGAAKGAAGAVGKAASKVGSAIAGAAKSAWSATKAFGEKAWKGLKSTAQKAWKLTTAAAKTAAAKLKAAAKAVSQKVMNALLAGAKKYFDKYRSTVEPFKKAFASILQDASWKPILKRTLEKIAQKKIDAQLKTDMKAIARKLGIGAKWACAPGRRSAQAPCESCGITAFSLGLNAGVGAVAGIEGGVGVVAGAGGFNAFAEWGWSLGIQAEAGADVVLSLYPDVDVGGDGVGLSAAGKWVGGIGFGIDWDGSNLSSIGKGCPSFSIAGGVGVGGGINVGWSHAYDVK